MNKTPDAVVHTDIDPRTGQRTTQLVRPFITTRRLGPGWAAVMFHWNNEDPEIGGFWEIREITGRFATEKKAVWAAREWAGSCGIIYQRREVFK